jgi:hypothetical protein
MPTVSRASGVVSWPSVRSGRISHSGVGQPRAPQIAPATSAHIIGVRSSSPQPLPSTAAREPWAGPSLPDSRCRARMSSQMLKVLITPVRPTSYSTA